MTFTGFGGIEEESASSSGFDLEEHEDILSITSIKGDVLVDGTKVSSVSVSGDTESIPYYELFDTTKTGETKTVSVVSDGNVITSKTIELKSNYYPYRDPSTLEKEDVEILSKTGVYSGNDIRLAGSEENFKVNFTKKYNPDDFKYDWRRGGYILLQ